MMILIHSNVVYFVYRFFVILFIDVLQQSWVFEWHWLNDSSHVKNALFINLISTIFILFWKVIHLKIIHFNSLTTANISPSPPLNHNWNFKKQFCDGKA